MDGAPPIPLVVGVVVGSAHSTRSSWSVEEVPRHDHFRFFVLRFAHGKVCVCVLSKKQTNRGSSNRMF